MWSNSGVYTHYKYAPDYRLLQARIEGQNRVFSFSHDPDGQRQAKYLNNQLVEAYKWLDFVRMAAFYDGQHEYEFAYRDGERTPFAMRRGDGAEAFLFYDQVGSLRVIADSSGNVIKEILYDPFGGVIKDTNENLRIPIGFAGGLHDRDLDFVRFGWRDYDTLTSRWTAPDPIGDAGGDPDWYGYCLDDPVNGVDPLGLFRFGKRPLEGPLSLLGNLDTGGGWMDSSNLEPKHEHGFYEDGTGDNLGLFKEGVKRTEDIANYKLEKKQYDDSRMRRSEASVVPGEYDVATNNCQDFASKLRSRYSLLLRGDNQR